MRAPRAGRGSRRRAADRAVGSRADVLVEQRGATFGERFDHALRDAYAASGGPIVLVGADTPHLGGDDLRAAFERLEDVDAVVGPSAEGGFYLVGFRDRPVDVRATFDHAHEAAALARLLRGEGTVGLLAPSFDLDVPGDLVELMLRAQLHRALGAELPAPATLRVLDRAVVLAASASGERGRTLLVARGRG